MKTIISFFIFSFLIIGINAQEITNKADHNKNEENAISSDKDITSNSQETYTAAEKDICYSEISKVTFYEALIRQNNFDIELKESDNIALKNTEDIIKRNKNRISYSD